VGRDNVPHEELDPEYSFDRDVFELWKLHYNCFGNKEMEKRIKIVKDIYTRMIWEGDKKSGMRMLDHGVCSGLISLLYVTFFYEIYFSFEEGTEPEKTRLNKLSNFILGNIAPHINNANGKSGYEASWWFSRSLWGTAAAAIHNIQQTEWAYEKPHCLTPLKVDDDPIAYLGILVDIIQEWDRYSVAKDSVFNGGLPIQGNDVKLSMDNDKVIIAYNDKGIADKVLKNLEMTLVGYNKFVTIRC